MPTQVTDKRVAIVGGGIAGLTAALRLSERGYNVTVLERDHDLGGMLGANNGRILFAINPRPPLTTDAICKELDGGDLPDTVRQHFKEAHNNSKSQADNIPSLPKEVNVVPTRKGLKWHVSFFEGTTQHSFFISRRERYEDKETRGGRPVKGSSLDHITDSRDCLHVHNGAFYEHCFHMYLNWYHNFWQIVEDDLGLDREDLFHRRPTVKYLTQDAFPRYTGLTDVGAINTALPNLISGVAAPHDMFLYAYSLVDLLATPFHRDWLSMFTVNGFMRSRWYATNGSALLHQDTLAKAFSIPSFLTAAHAYKKFIHFGTPVPSPMLWLMKGNVQTHFIYPLEDVLRRHGCKIMRGVSVEDWEFDESNADSKATKIKSIKWRYAKWDDDDVLSPEPPFDMDVDFVILAVQIESLNELLARPSDHAVSKPVMEIEPALHGVRQLRSESMASLDIYFKRKLDNIPPDNVVLEGSEFKLTFVDNSQNWVLQGDQIGARTILNVTASNIHALPTFVDMENAEHQRKIIWVMINGLAEFVKGFDPGSAWGESHDIDWNLTNLRMNLDQRILINEVGSARSRPKHKYDTLENLFFAGDPVQNIIEVVTIEGAVMTGITAARDVYAADPLGDPIEVKVPYHYPRNLFVALKLLGFPAAVAAKSFALAESLTQITKDDFNLDDVVESQANLASGPFELAQRLLESNWSTYMNFVNYGLQRGPFRKKTPSSKPNTTDHKPRP